MDQNPYEPPLTEPDKAPATFVIRFSNTYSVIVSIVAAGIGGTLFIVAPYLDGVYTRILTGVAATFVVFTAAHWRIQERASFIISTIIGMLLASPVAMLVAATLFGQAYDLGTKGKKGGEVYAYLAFYSFFLVTSCGGWLATRVMKATEYRAMLREHLQ